jgi:protein phosphatase
MTIESHGISDAGRVRNQNQDRILVQPQIGLFAVFDGMGGRQRGDLAAEVASTVVQTYVATSHDPADVTWPFGYNYTLSIPANRLLTSVRLANRQVWRRADESLDYAGMGATVAAILAGQGRVAVANVGDSRVYRLRQDNLEQLSIDDNVVSLLLEKGLITPEQVRTHPMRTVLTQAAGSKEGVEVHLRDEVLEPGDLYLITSDGLHGYVDSGLIHDYLQHATCVEECAAKLVRAAHDAESTDNISVVIARFA